MELKFEHLSIHENETAADRTITDNATCLLLLLPLPLSLIPDLALGSRVKPRHDAGTSCGRQGVSMSSILSPVKVISSIKEICFTSLIRFYYKCREYMARWHFV